jgi:cytochrome P450
VDRKDIIKAIKQDLARHNTSNFESLRDEIQYALDKELGACKDWSPICVVFKLTSIIALLSGRVFVGLPLSRNKKWIDATVNYTKDIVIAREAIIRKPAIIRDFVAPFLPEVKSVKRSNKRSAALLEPLVKEVLTRETDERYGNEEDKTGTMVSWMLQYSDDKSVETLVNYQMTLSFTAIFTTASAASQVIFDLVCRPKYMQHLRDEIRQVIDEDGYDDSGLTRNIKRQSILKLQKLDSFIKESQRLSPFSLVSMDRITMAPLKLSTGHTIPKGVHVAFPPTLSAFQLRRLISHLSLLMSSMDSASISFVTQKAAALVSVYLDAS